MARILFITGTDTGVGKTFVTALLTRHLRGLNRAVAALKPICSGGRDDARQLRAAQDGTLSLEEVNPWHFRAALAPVLAARVERRQVTKFQVVRHIQQLARRFELVLIEGAGGLLSPLGESFDSRDLMDALGATAIVVAPNRLGAVNQVRLVLAALPPGTARIAEVVLVNPPRAGDVIASNPRLLSEFFPARQIHLLPWISSARKTNRRAADATNVIHRLATKVCNVPGRATKSAQPSDA
ncbi:MAG: dethiobiotin synthetase [Verrucomicrobiota bacterium]|jgi:dethiobiotin synthetase